MEFGLRDFGRQLLVRAVPVEAALCTYRVPPARSGLLAWTYSVPSARSGLLLKRTNDPLHGQGEWAEAFWSQASL